MRIVREHLRRILLVAGVATLAATAAACWPFGGHQHKGPGTADSQEPDKVLYERALEDIEKRRWDVARLTLQTLINTYPDSDYLAAAKLAIADSYFSEGTTSALTHAEVEYKDYITFFPSDPKAPFAQYRAALCHWRQLEKADRDRTQARRAEEEFQQLLKMFPDSEYAADGERKLLQVQELLADGEYRVGRFYFIRGSWRASASRLSDLVERYPNFSQRDDALWMLGEAFGKQLPYYWDSDVERSAAAYARLIREHPTSTHVADAKAELQRLGRPIPEPDPTLLARAQTVQPVGPDPEKEHEGLLGRMFGMFGVLNTRPDLSRAAARLGPPPLEPPPDLPKLPPPRIAGAPRASSVTAKTVPGTVQTTDDVPAGTLVGSNSAGGSASSGNASGSAQNPNPQGPSGDAAKKDVPAPRKKSFWRKLIPFW
jgi:outer membrane protein assembly factor BamD